MQKILQSTFISSIYSVKRKLENIIFKTFVQVRVFSGLSFFIGGVRRRLFHNDVQIACVFTKPREIHGFTVCLVLFLKIPHRSEWPLAGTHP